MTDLQNKADANPCTQTAQADVEKSEVSLQIYTVLLQGLSDFSSLTGTIFRELMQII